MMAPKSTRPAQPTYPRNLPCPTRIPGSFSVFTEGCKLENTKPDGLGLSGRKGQNLSEPTRVQPYNFVYTNVKFFNNKKN